MRDLNKLIDDIIPYPDDREHREEFLGNESIIAKLTDDEKKEIEVLLLDKLKARPDDLLIDCT